MHAQNVHTLQVEVWGEILSFIAWSSKSGYQILLLDNSSSAHLVVPLALHTSLKCPSTFDFSLCSTVGAWYESWVICIQSCPNYGTLSERMFGDIPGDNSYWQRSYERRARWHYCRMMRTPHPPFPFQKHFPFDISAWARLPCTGIFAE